MLLIIIFGENVTMFSQNYGVLYNLGSNTYALQNVNLNNSTYNYGVDRIINNLRIGSNVAPGNTQGYVNMSSTCHFSAIIQNELFMQSGFNFSRDAFLQIRQNNKLIMEINKNGDTHVDGLKFASNVYLYNKEGKGAKVRIGPTNVTIYTDPYKDNELLGFKMLEANNTKSSLAIAPYHVFFGGYYNHFESDRSITLQVTGEVITTGVYISTSDKRLKSDIKNIGNRFASIYNLNCNIGSDIFSMTQLEESNSIKSNTNENFEVSTKDLEKYFPELITSKSDGIIGVDYIGLIPILIETLKQQQNDLLKNESIINNLKDRFRNLKDGTNN